MELHDPLAIWFAIEHAENEEGDLRQGWEIEVRDFTVERWVEEECYRHCEHVVATATSTAMRAPG